MTSVQGIYAYCTLNDGVEYTDGLKKELVMAVREQIGAFAAPDVIHWAPGGSVLQAVKPADHFCQYRHGDVRQSAAAPV